MNTRILIGALTALLIASVLAAPAAMAADWPQFQYDIASTGNTPSDAPDDNNTRWVTADIGAIEGSQAMIVGDKVFVYANDYVRALKTVDGTSAWTAANAGLVYGDTSGWGSWASPAYYDGKLYVSSGYNISRINATDGDVEEMILFPDGGHSCNGGPTVADNDTTDHGIVFAGSGYEGYPSHYYAFNASDLSEVFWNFALDAAECAGSTPAVAGNRVIVGNGSSLTCVAKNSQGAATVLWTTDLHGGNVLGSAAIDSANDMVYVATISGSLAHLHALNLTDGNLTWTSIPIKATDGTPTFMDMDHIYISGSTWGNIGSTYCFNSTGDLRWTLPRGSWCMSPAITADGKLITGDCDDHGGYGTFEGIGAYDATTGALIWEHAYGGSSPSVANSDPMVVSIGKNGKVYGFAPPVIISCDVSGNEKNAFYATENVSVKGIGLEPNTNYTIWIQPCHVSEDDVLNNDPSTTQENVMTDGNGDFSRELIWEDIPMGPLTNYDIVADNNDSGTVGTYNAASDVIDAASTEVGFTAPVPELASAMLVGGGLLMLVGIMRFGRRRMR